MDLRLRGTMAEITSAIPALEANGWKVRAIYPGDPASAYFNHVPSYVPHAQREAQQRAAQEQVRPAPAHAITGRPALRDVLNSILR